MVEYAKEQFKMFTPDARGTTLYDSLKIVEKAGFKPAELVKFESALLPSDCAEIWQDFTELSASRQQTSEGPCPIVYRDIVAWASLSNKNISAYRCDVLFAIDRAWLDNYYKNQEKLRKQSSSKKK